MPLTESQIPANFSVILLIGILSLIYPVTLDLVTWNWVTIGLYYKNMTIVNDATSQSITLESSITLQELSIMLLENIYVTRIARENHHMTIIICL